MIWGQASGRLVETDLVMLWGWHLSCPADSSGNDCSLFYMHYDYELHWNRFASTQIKRQCVDKRDKNAAMEMPGIEPGAFHMQSERSTTEPHPQLLFYMFRITINRNNFRHVHHNFRWQFYIKTYVRRRNISCILTYDLIGNMLEITFSHIHLFYIEVQIFDGCVA